MLISDPSALARVIVSGLLAYVSLVLILRIAGKRTLSKWNAFDFIVTIALGSSLATAILSRNTSLAQGVLGFALLIALQFAVTWLAVRSGRFEQWLKARPRLLLHEGKLLEDAIRAERVTETEILAAIRSHGISAIEDVMFVVLETDGTFSVIQRVGSSVSALRSVTGLPNATGRELGR